MFCQACGNKIPEGGRFCTYCGQKVIRIEDMAQNREQQTEMPQGTVKARESVHNTDNPVENTAGSPVQQLAAPAAVPKQNPVAATPASQPVHRDNSRVIDKLKKILPYVRRVERDLERIEELKKQIQEDAWQEQKNQENRDDFAVNHQGLLAAIFLGLTIVIALPFMLLTQNEVFLFLAAIPAGVLTYKFCKWIKAPNDDHLAAIERQKETVEEIEQGLRDYCAGHSVSKEIDVVPKEYCYVEAIEYFLRMLQNGRAETMKEAINLYEEYCYREDMKSMQTQQSQAIDGVSAQIDRQTELIENQGRQLSEQMGQVQRTASKAKHAARVNTALNIYGMLKR